jgi:heme exporter protein B
MIAANQENQASSAYSITIIWFALLSSLIFSFAEFLKKDFEDGTVEQLLISCPNFEIVVLAKILAGWLVYCLPIVISAAIFLQLSEIAAQFSCGFLLSLTLASWQFLSFVVFAEVCLFLLALPR